MSENKNTNKPEKRIFGFNLSVCVREGFQEKIDSKISSGEFTPAHSASYQVEKLIKEWMEKD